MIDDASEWGTPKRARKSEKRQRSVVVSVRLNQRELAHIQALAKEKGQTISTYMRERAIVGEFAAHTYPPTHPASRYETVITGWQQ